MDPIWIPFGPQQLKFWTPAWYSPVVRDSLLLCVLDSFCSILESLSGSILPVFRSLRCRRSMRPPSRPTANKNTPNLKPLKTKTRLTVVVSGYAANVPKTYVSWHHVLMSSPICYIYLFPPHAWHCPPFLPLVLSENSCIRNPHARHRPKSRMPLYSTLSDILLLVLSNTLLHPKLLCLAKLKCCVPAHASIVRHSRSWYCATVFLYLKSLNHVLSGVISFCDAL